MAFGIQYGGLNTLDIIFFPLCGGEQKYINMYEGVSKTILNENLDLVEEKAVAN